MEELTSNTADFTTKAPFTVSPSASELQYSYFTQCNVSVWWCLDCPKLKAFVLKLRGDFQALPQCCDIEVFYFVLSHWIQCLTVYPNRYSIALKCPPLASAAICCNMNSCQSNCYHYNQSYSMMLNAKMPCLCIKLFTKCTKQNIPL